MLPRKVVLKSGEWVDAQALDCSDKNLFWRMLVLQDTEGDLQEVQGNGWCFVQVVRSQLRIRCWVKQFKEIAP